MLKPIETCRASFSQQRLWFLNEVESANGLYNIPLAFKIEGDLNLTALKYSFQRIIERHEIIRTNYFYRDGQVWQRVMDDASLEITIHELGSSEENKGVSLQEKIQQLQEMEVFDLEKDVMLKVTIFSLSDSKWYLLVNMHHIAFDGWSLPIFFHEISVCYEDFCQGRKNSLKPLQLQYTHYTNWQRNWLEGPLLTKQLNYWKKKLKDLPAVHNLPLDNARPSRPSYRGGHNEHVIRNELASNVVSFCREHGITLFVFMYTAFSIFICRYSNERDIAIGTPISGRVHKDIESLIGFFVNTLVLRCEIDKEDTIDKLLKENKEIILDAFSNQYVPFELLVEELKPKRSLSYSPLFQVFFTFQSETMSVPSFSGVRVSPLQQPCELSKFDLSLSIEEADGVIITQWQYATDLFNRDTIQRWSKNLITLIRAMIEQPGQYVSTIAVTSKQERHDLLFEWNDLNTFSGDSNYKSSIQDWFIDTAKKYPDKTAVIELIDGREHSVSYGYLDYLSDILALEIRKQTLNPDSLVGIYLDRGVDMVLGILATAKSGAGYVPIDPTYPRERVEYIIGDSKIKSLIIQKKYLNNVQKFYFLSVVLVDVRASLKKDKSAVSTFSSMCDTVSRKSTVAYVIYTSGSTGQPKGVMIEHKNALAFLNWVYSAYARETLQTVLASTSICFDLSIFEIFSAFLKGGQLVVVKNLLQLVDSGFHQPISLINTVPSAIDALIRQRRLPPTVVAVNIAGEPLHRDLVDRIYQNSSVEKVYNLYGPTEATTYSTTALLSRVDKTKPTIGKSILGTRIYILDEHLEPVTIGVTGELYVAGSGLARGYLRNAVLTAEKFIPDPFTPGSRLYRTGDHVRRLANGDIEYIGRIDNQIKLNGYRIDTGEIEARIRSSGFVKDTLVMVDGESWWNKRLLAYIVSRNTKTDVDEYTACVSDLKSYLSEFLPDFMLPGLFILLENLPLTPNGKIDRKSLPCPFDMEKRYTSANVNNTEHYTELNEEGGCEVGNCLKEIRDFNEIQKSQQSQGVRKKSYTRENIQSALVTIWKALLKCERLGVDNNFFDLGGHSLMAVQMRALIFEKIKIQVDLADIFIYNNIRTMTDYIEKKQNRRIETTDETPAKKFRNGKISSDFRSRSGDRLSSIAIIGLAGKFPAADSVDEYWRNILNGVEAFEELSDSELQKNGVGNTLLNNPHYVKGRMKFSGADLFDNDFFQMNDQLAKITDPQNRVLLECAYHALENAGYPEESEGVNVGVFVGKSSNLNRYLNLLQSRKTDSPVDQFNFHLQNERDFLAQQVSYKLNLTGPSINISTACSTSLVAVQEACWHLVNGTCSIALAGGVSISASEALGYLHQQGFIQSVDGHCRPFDSEASGSVQGNGVGLVVLKELSRARRDGDTIHAVIRGWGVSNDGAGKVGFTAPGVHGQEAAITAAYEMAGINPWKVRYIEAHGSGTPLGDAIEFQALTRAFRRFTNQPENPAQGQCVLGSVKANIGHLDAAAGIAGLIKVVQALRQHYIPPSINFKNPHPELNLSDSPFCIQTVSCFWNQLNRKPRLAAVSSTAIGGTNVHMVLEEAEPLNSQEEIDSEYLLLLSAKSRQALEKMRRNLSDFLCCNPSVSMRDVAYTLQKGRAAYPIKAFWMCRDRDDALNQLISEVDFNSKNNDKEAEGDTAAVILYLSDSSVDFSFIGLDFFLQFTAFELAINRCFDNLDSKVVQEIKNRYFNADVSCTDNDIDSKEYLENLYYFIIHYALLKYWLAIGVKPSGIVGEGRGEYVAACISGIISLKAALKLVGAKKGERYFLQAGDVGGAQIPFLTSVNGNWINQQSEIDFADWKSREIFNRHRSPTALDISGKTLVLSINPEKNTEVESLSIKPFEYLSDIITGATNEQNRIRYIVLLMVAKLWRQGVSIHWDAFYRNINVHRIPLPLYPFQRQSFSMESVGSAKANHKQSIANNSHSIDVIKDVVRNIWLDIFGTEDLRNDDNFFQIGGDSLQALRVIDGVEKYWGLEITVEEIYLGATIDIISQRIYESRLGNKYLTEQ